MTDVAVNFTGKVRGFNLTSKPGHPLESDYWAEWDWTGWIRKQIDYAASLGSNVVRIIGDVTVVDSGSITQNTYNTRMQQFVDYCVSLGISVYYTGCATYGTDGVSNGTTALSDATIAGIINSNIGSITGASGAPDYSAYIIGCDIVQEANANLNNTRVNNIYSLVKPNVPSSIGCTFSNSNPMTSTGWMNLIINSCDFLDYHIYPGSYGGIGNCPTPTTVTNSLRATYPTKEILFGEGGASQGFTSQQVNDWIAGLATIGNMADAKVRGQMTWAVQDQGTQTDQKYGAFLAAWTPRSDVVLPFVRGLGGTTGTPVAPTKLRLTPSGLLVWDPTGCSSIWDSTRLYRNGSQIVDQSYCLYDDSASWPSATSPYRYQVTAVAAGVESARSTAFYYPGGLGWIRD